MEESQETNTVSKKSPNLIMIGGIFVAIVLVGLGFFMNSDKTFSDTSQIIDTNTTDINEPDVEGMETSTENEEDPDLEIIKVEAESFYFSPEEIRVRVGDNVKIELISKDMMHDFVIDELGVKSPVTLAGETSIIEFTPQEVGEFEYYCSVANHRAMGQVGTLIVEE